MSTLANHAFVKMNGLGNEIVVVDMRREAGAISAAEARAAAQPAGAPYDQLMTLHAPRTPGTDAYVRIYNNDGSECGRLRQRHALHRRDVVRGDRQDARSPSRPGPGC